MARIRTVKPEFWTDEKIVQLPFSARLFFIGLWNYADDNGRLWNEPAQLKMRIFPADEINVAESIDLLEAAGIIRLFEDSEGRGVIEIPHFGDHQKISHPTPSKIPAQAQNGRKKVPVPTSERRRLALKYGCQPGESVAARCHFCESSGAVVWIRHYSGKPSSWVVFSELEIDHLIPESSGGPTTAENLVLSCRSCNRSRGNKSASEFTPENSRGLRGERIVLEGNGMERSGTEVERSGMDRGGAAGSAPARAPAAPAPEPREPRPGEPGFQSMGEIAAALGVPDPLAAKPPPALLPKARLAERKAEVAAKLVEAES